MSGSLEVYSNFYELTPRDYRKVYHHYNVITGTPEPKRRDRSIIIDRLQTQNSADLFRRRAVFDGQNSLYSTIKLESSDGALSFNVNKFDSQPRVPNQSIYNVKLVEVGSVTFGDLQPVVSGNGYTNNAMLVLQVLNLVVRQAAIQKNPAHKLRSFYVDSKESVVNIGALELWAGVFQSVRPTLGKVLVNIDISAACMYRRGLLHDVAMSFLGFKNIRELERLNPRDSHWIRLKSFLKKVRVEILTGNKPNSKKRVRMIDDLEASAGLYKFTKDNAAMTVQEYYKEARNVNLQYPRIPGIRTGPDAVIPFELCKIVPGQFYKKKLSGEDTSSMLKFTKKNPKERIDAIKGALNTLAYTESDYMREAGLSVGKEPISIPARIIPAPLLNYGGNSSLNPNNGSWNLLEKQFFQPGRIHSWAVVCYDAGFHQNDQQTFIRGLQARLNALGIIVENAPSLYIGLGHDPLKGLNTAVNDTNAKFRKLPSIIIVLLPFPSPSLRKAVKVWGDTIAGIPTQIARTDKIRTRANDQYFNNVALKINAKIGGVSATLSGAGMAWFREKPTMILGADVNHPAPGVNRPSIASLVNTVNDLATIYFANVRVQAPRQEIIEDLGGMFQQAIQQFCSYWYSKVKSNVLPERIVMYRDGVSEGEFKSVADHELKTMTETLKSLWKQLGVPAEKPLPTITFIIVGKRHHVRFFPTKPQDADRSGNLRAGLVVNSRITSPIKEAPDFYLQSHSGLLGTSRPSHYTVLKDENRMSPEQLWALSYDLCYLYARCTRAVSIPAPVYYADICCARADFHFEQYDFDDDNSTEGGFDLERWRRAFKGPTESQAKRMYFM